MGGAAVANLVRRVLPETKARAVGVARSLGWKYRLPRPGFAGAWSRVRQVASRRIWLIAPLTAFMAVFFVIPLLTIFTHAVWDPSVSAALPRTTAVLNHWNHKRPVSSKAYAALDVDLVRADKNGSLWNAATRLNYDMAGFRSLLMKTAHQLERTGGRGTARQRNQRAVKNGILRLEPKWHNLAYWRVLARDSHPFTLTYMLRAVDLKETPNGSIKWVGKDQAIFVTILARTFEISVVVTILALALGYPLAYWLCGVRDDRRIFVMMAILMPFWTSVLVRIATWMVLLPTRGVLNEALLTLHIISSPLNLLYDRAGVYIAMVNVLLPFMVLPLYSVMRDIPETYQKAAQSLGSHPFGALMRVYVPQTFPGISAGCSLVFILALGYYIIPGLLGSASDAMISNYIAYYTNTRLNWGLASALSLMLIITAVMLFILLRILSSVWPAVRRIML